MGGAIGSVIDMSNNVGVGLSTWIAAMATEYTGKKLFIPAFFPEPEYGDAFVDSGLKVAEISQFQMAIQLS